MTKKNEIKKSLHYNSYYTGNKKSNVGSSGLGKAPDTFTNVKKANELRKKNKQEVKKDEQGYDKSDQ